LLPLLLVGSSAYGQATEPTTEATRTDERQFAGEVVAVDVAGKTLTVKASQVDTKGERVEKTMTLPVEEAALKQLESITTGDKVTVLWRKDQATQRDTVVKLLKGETAKDEATPPKD
jgi:hypothetical protein